MPTRTLDEVKRLMIENGRHWYVPFMDFVDEFRRSHSEEFLNAPLHLDHPKYDALLASTLENLCDEAGIEPPGWAWETPSCVEPWFVSGMENLKAISIVESPSYFRRRKIFVLENFLSRA